MSQEFNLRYNEIQPEINANDNMPLEQSECVTYYETEGHARNVCFVFENGNRIFLNYAHLLFCEYIHEIGAINLIFTSHRIILEGCNTGELFKSFLSQKTQEIVVQSSRYNTFLENDSAIVFQIKVIQLPDEGV
ncbi:MAG: hypothetical protein J0H92_19355 [Sphingobacteriales bacterium]|nr:hypothetical protein [Sphingobacteriales bacterium]OJW32080.1 MAG: hypothetical protein BGO54_16840 [Sphingobacteriales bacterium 46-32]